jgi:hypothetical protein
VADVEARPGHSVNRINSVRYFGFFRNSINEKQKPKLYMGNCKPSVRFSIYSVRYFGFTEKTEQHITVISTYNST